MFNKLCGVSLILTEKENGLILAIIAMFMEYNFDGCFLKRIYILLTYSNLVFPGLTLS